MFQVVKGAKIGTARRVSPSSDTVGTRWDESASVGTSSGPGSCRSWVPGAGRR